MLPSQERGRDSRQKEPKRYRDPEIGLFRLDFHPTPSRRKPRFHGRLALNGETRIRTGDTTIFSRVLYQLSYLAATIQRLATGAWRGCAPPILPAPQRRQPRRRADQA